MPPAMPTKSQADGPFGSPRGTGGGGFASALALSRAARSGCDFSSSFNCCAAHFDSCSAFGSVVGAGSTTGASSGTSTDSNIDCAACCFWTSAPSVRKSTEVRFGSNASSAAGGPAGLGGGFTGAAGFGAGAARTDLTAGAGADGFAAAVEACFRTERGFAPGPFACGRSSSSGGGVGTGLSNSTGACAPLGRIRFGTASRSPPLDSSFRWGVSLIPMSARRKCAVSNSNARLTPELLSACAATSASRK